MWVESQDEEILINLNRTKELYVKRMMKSSAYAQKLISCSVCADNTDLVRYMAEDGNAEKQARRTLKYLKGEITSHGKEADYVCRMPKGDEDKNDKEERICNG